MSRSHKLAILKDHPRNVKKSSEYWRKVRRTSKTVVKQFSNSDDFEDIEGKLKNPKSIVNDYDYTDWIFDMEFNKPINPSDRVKNRRK